MSLVLFILLSFLILAVTLLFLATKDRWNWRKIILWPNLIGTTLAILGVASFYFYSVVSDWPQVQTSFWEISLDSSKEDIRFKKGEPTIFSYERWRYVVDINAIDDTIASYDIIFKDKKLWAVMYFQHLSSRSGKPTLQKIGVGTTLEQVIEKFGSPSHVSNSKDDLMRIISFEKYNVVFRLEQNQVYAFGIYNPALGPLEQPTLIGKTMGR